MEVLSYLSLGFNSYRDPSDVIRIQNYCKSLQIFVFDMIFDGDYAQYIEEMIGQMKYNLIKRNTSLTL